MKKIINGKKYDTDTAAFVAHYESEHSVTDWHWYEEGTKMTGDPNTVTFMAIPAGTYYFKLYKRNSDSDHWDQPCGSINSAGGTAYDSSGKQSGDCGAMWIKTNEVANITFTMNGSDKVDITATK